MMPTTVRKLEALESIESTSMRLWKCHSVIFLLSILAFVFSGCQQIPRSNFDPYQDNIENASHEDGHWEEGFELKREIPKDLLQISKEPYRLGPGDVLEIEISEIPGTRTQTFVMPDGMVYYDLAPGIKAEGLTIAEFGELLTEALKNDYIAPLLNITLVSVKSQRYWILGRVYKPGLYPLNQPTTLIEAISQAGGLFSARFGGSTEELADLNNSVLIRNGHMIPVDFEKLIQQGDMSQNVYLRHNDYIHIPSITSANILLLGAVVKPKAVPCKGKMGLVQCLANGNGPLKNAFLDKVVVIRGSLNKPRVAVVNFNKIMRGSMRDIQLQPGDRVWVPFSPWEKIEQYIDTILSSAANTIAINEGGRFADTNAADQASANLTPSSF